MVLNHKHLLKIKSHREIPHRLAPEETIHFPGGIRAEEVSQQGATRSKSITSCERSDTSGLEQDGYWRSAVHSRWPFDLVECTVPRRTKIEELHKLEVATERVVDGFIEESREYRKANLTVDHYCVVTV